VVVPDAEVGADGVAVPEVGLGVVDDRGCSGPSTAAAGVHGTGLATNGVILPGDLPRLVGCEAAGSKSGSPLLLFCMARRMLAAPKTTVSATSCPAVRVGEAMSNTGGCLGVVVEVRGGDVGRNVCLDCGLTAPSGGSLWLTPCASIIVLTPGVVVPDSAAIVSRLRRRSCDMVSGAWLRKVDPVGGGLSRNTEPETPLVH